MPCSKAARRTTCWPASSKRLPRRECEARGAAVKIRVIPGRVALLLVAVAAAAGFAALILNVPLALVAQLTAVAVIVLITVAVGDFFATRLAWRKSSVQMIRKLPPAFAVGVSKPVRVIVRAEGALAWRCKLYDHADPSFITDGMPKPIELWGGKEVEIQYTVTPTRR